MKTSLSALCLLGVLASCTTGFASEQTVLNLKKTEPTFEYKLSTVPSQEFTYFSHPAFPDRSARIKKTHFCDGSVNAYTGYIDVASRHLFFYFFESRNDPSKDDVVLWTNGGPGGSSSIGLLMELGPCSIISENKTEYNPYAWNDRANVFFIDQPVGTGFSYSDYGELVTTTEESAKDIAAFMAIFFETFSEFKGRGFHLSGESYAGRYLPVYASAIYDQNAILKEKGLTTVNLQSVLIGNGATDFAYLYPSYYKMQCSGAVISPVQSIGACVQMQQILPRCQKRLQESCFDHWDLIDCEEAHNFCSTGVMMPYMELKRSPYDITRDCSKSTVMTCYDEETWIEQYLGSPQIRELIGADDKAGNFSTISFEVHHAFTKAGDTMHQNQPYVAELLERGIRVLIYAGTYDWICNWIGNEEWTLEMEWSGQKEFAAKPLREWKVDGKVAGLTRRHGNFAFATIVGAGHMAPHDKPNESLTMLNRWLANEDF